MRWLARLLEPWMCPHVWELELRITLTDNFWSDGKTPVGYRRVYSCRKCKAQRTISSEG